MNSEFLKFIGFTIAGLTAVAVLANISQNPRVNPNLRFVAQTAEGIIVHDLETGLLRLV